MKYTILFLRSLSLLTYLMLMLALSSCRENMDSEIINTATSPKTRATSSNEIGAGGICGTPAPEPPSWFFTRSTSGLNYSTAYVFKIYTHIIRSSSGVGLDKSEISSTILETLNSYYGETNLSFTLMGSEYIDSDEFNLLSEANAKLVFSLNSHSNAIDIYIFSSGENLGNLAGLAQTIPATACLIRNGTYANRSTLIHEVGHCLGLYHTHHGTSASEGGIAELVDGSNSAIAGDYITDTPADPGRWAWMENYSGVGVDANGDTYQPDPWNIMSYSGYARNKLTQKQVERIFSTITNNSNLRNATWLKGTSNISGPSYIDNGSVYSIEVPDGYGVNWKVRCDTYTNRTGISTSSYTYFTGKRITLTNKNPQAVSQCYTLDVTITTPKGYVFHTSKTVRHVLFSANTGLLEWRSESSKGNYNGQIKLSLPPSSSPIKVYQGGNLYFYYKDASGGYSVTEPSIYNFEITGSTAFTKMSGGNHAFSCLQNATANNSELLLHVFINGRRTIMSIPYQILR